MAGRYQVATKVYDTDGSTPLANLKVTLRMESTNESLEENTNASGEAIFNLTNLPSDWTVGDILTVLVMYRGFEASKEHTTTEGGGVTLELTLIASPAAPSLRYYNPQDFLDYFNMKTYEEDSENGIKMQQLVKMGEMVEGGIDDDTGTKFDDNDDSYYSVTDEYHDVSRGQSVFYLEKTPIVTLNSFFVNKSDEDSNPSWDNIAYTLLDACDATTNWTASSANSEVTLAANLVPSNSNSSLGSIYIAKAGTNDTTLTITRNDLTAQDFTNKTLNIDLYVDTAAEFSSSDAVTIRYGSASNAYFQKTFDRADLKSANWKTLSMHYEDSDITVTGSPDITACDYFAIILELVGASTELTSGDARLDNFRFEDAFDLDLKKARGEIKITKQSNYAEEGKNQAKATYTYGRSTVPLDIKELAILETGFRMFGAAFVKGKIMGKIDTRMDFTEGFYAYRSRIITKYNITGVDSIIGNA